MMPEVASTTHDGDAAAAAELLAFATGVRRRQRMAAMLGAAARALLAVAVPALLLAWLWPAARAGIAGAVAGFAGLAATIAAWPRRQPARLGLGAVDATGPSAIAAFDDELATWLEGRTAPRTPMRDWLLRHAVAQLPAVRPVAAAAVRPRLGRSAWLLPVVLVLLLAWLLSAWLVPPWSGLLGGGQDRPEPAGGGSGDDSGAGGSRASAGARDPVPGAPSPIAPPAPAPQPEPPSPAGPSEPPAPLLDLPAQQQFVVPDFVGDGPTTRARMHVAEVQPVGGVEARAAAPRGDGEAVAPPPPAAEQFERAAERALQSRHVPPAERAMVRRFFAALRQAAR